MARTTNISKMSKRIGLMLLLLFTIVWETTAQKQIVLVKAYKQTLEPFRNEEIGINGGPFAAVDKNGQLFREFDEQELPPTSVQLKNQLFEVATWNYSKGKLEIVVRAKTNRKVLITVLNDQQPVGHQPLVYQGKLQGSTNTHGSLEFTVPLNEVMQKEKFEVEGFSLTSLELQADNKYVLQVTQVQSANLAKADSIVPNAANLPKTSKSKLVELDSVHSFSQLYALFKELEFKKIDERLHKKINDKFRELLRESGNGERLPGYTKLITDTSRINEDIMNLVMQARADRDLINAQRTEFDRSAEAIQEKLSAGIENLNETERKHLINELGELETILMGNEKYFSENHTYFVDLLSTMKEKFFDISILENKLSVSEAKRLEEQERFRERIILISSLVVVFAILVALLMRSDRRLRKVNQRISELNENLEGIVMERTKMLMLANKELDTFLYRASHDLRSPVCSIIGLCNIASHIANPESLDLLQKVTGTVHVMDRLLKKLSVISEINEPSGFGRIDLKESIFSALETFESTIRENNVKVDIRCDDNIVFMSYPNLVNIVLSNILENALYYSLIKNSQDARIEIEATTHEDNIQVVITDNGIGIDNKIKSRLFDMFFKGNENSKGNGLGLYIVIKSIQALKGEVEVESQPGQYSKFTVTLPDNMSVKQLKLPEIEETVSR